MNITKAAADNDFKWITSAADEIWHEWFPSILSDEQIDYMLDKFLSFKAIKELVAGGCEFYIFSDGDRRLGFTELEEKSDKTLFLSKLYLFKPERGKGYATQAFEFIKSEAAERSLKSVWLTVNKNNGRAIGCYKKNGFKITKSIVTDIGKGYVMDDYVFSIDI